MPPEIAEARILESASINLKGVSGRPPVLQLIEQSVVNNLRGIERRKAEIAKSSPAKAALLRAEIKALESRNVSARDCYLKAGGETRISAPVGVSPIKPAAVTIGAADRDRMLKTLAVVEDKLASQRCTVDMNMYNPNVSEPRKMLATRELIRLEKKSDELRKALGMGRRDAPTAKVTTNADRLRRLEAAEREVELDDLAGMRYREPSEAESYARIVGGTCFHGRL